ncbi:ribonuclease inhibitor-like [Heterodontus francisci]|uniref:ribonuclease inhibitor-like n=1 Tax=Heterodontus francisci TaxID=7792 RepID=UPI00355B6530
METKFTIRSEHATSIRGEDGHGEQMGDETSGRVHHDIKEEDPLMLNNTTEKCPLLEVHWAPCTRYLSLDLQPEVKGPEASFSDTHLYRVNRFYCQRLLGAMDEFVNCVTFAPLEEVLFYRQEQEEVKQAAEMEESKGPSNHLLKMLKESDKPFGETMVDFLERLCDTKQELQNILKEINEKECFGGPLGGRAHCSSGIQVYRICPETEVQQPGNTEAVKNKRRLLDTMYLMSETCNANLLQMSRITLGHSQDPGKALRLCPLDCFVLAAALRPLGIVEELNLSRCGIEAEGIQQLSIILPHCKILRLSWNNLGDSGVKILCSSLRAPNCEIQELWVDYNGLTGVGTKELASAIVKNQSVVLLSLSYNKVGEATVKLLCDALKRRCCTIQHLRLCGIGFTPAYCRQLAWALCANRSVTVLDLDNNQLGDSGVKHLCGALMKPDCKIQTLRLGSNRLTALCTLELTHALNTNRSLRQLNLSYNRLNLPGLRRLSAALKGPACRIQKLELDDNGLRDACAEELASALSTNRRLKGLYLNRNSFTDRSIPAFHRLVESCRSLRYIWLWRNQFSAEGRNQLQSLKESTHRVTLFV